MTQETKTKLTGKARELMVATSDVRIPVVCADKTSIAGAEVFNPNAWTGESKGIVQSCWTEYSVLHHCASQIEHMCRQGENLCASQIQTIQQQWRASKFDLGKVIIFGQQPDLHIRIEAFLAGMKTLLDLLVQLLSSEKVVGAKVDGFHRVRGVYGGKVLNSLENNGVSDRKVAATKLITLISEHKVLWIDDAIFARDQLVHPNTGTSQLMFQLEFNEDADRLSFVRAHPPEINSAPIDRYTEKTLRHVAAFSSTFLRLLREEASNRHNNRAEIPDPPTQPEIVADLVQSDVFRKIRNDAFEKWATPVEETIQLKLDALVRDLGEKALSDGTLFFSAVRPIVVEDAQATETWANTVNSLCHEVSESMGLPEGIELEAAIREIVTEEVLMCSDSTLEGVESYHSELSVVHAADDDLKAMWETLRGCYRQVCRRFYLKTNAAIRGGEADDLQQYYSGADAATDRFDLNVEDPEAHTNFFLEIFQAACDEHLIRISSGKEAYVDGEFHLRDLIEQATVVFDEQMGIARVTPSEYQRRIKQLRLGLVDRLHEWKTKTEEQNPTTARAVAPTPPVAPGRALVNGRSVKILSIAELKATTATGLSRKYVAALFGVKTTKAIDNLVTKARLNKTHKGKIVIDEAFWAEYRERTSSKKG